MAIALSHPIDLNIFEDASAEVVVAHMLESFHPRLALASSFQKEESVILDMLLRANASARVFTIDTGVLFPETYAAWRALENYYGITVEVADARGDHSASACCGVHKVAALDLALAELDGWITGLRREQGGARAHAAKVEFDTTRGVYKANPLADWSEADVWRYIHEHELPYHPLHNRGYSSIGCAPCTAPGSGREGRWAGSERSECGLHL
jgi:phosphoadenosine phosphosulfate reductase